MDNIRVEHGLVWLSISLYFFDRISNLACAIHLLYSHSARRRSLDRLARKLARCFIFLLCCYPTKLALCRNPRPRFKVLSISSLKSIPPGERIFTVWLRSSELSFSQSCSSNFLKPQHQNATSHLFISKFYLPSKSNTESQRC